MLRSFRLGEADRVLHVYTADRGRVGAVAKGIRRTKSRFGARLEPLSHVELAAPPGLRRAPDRHRGLARSPRITTTREDPYRLARRPRRRRGDASALHRAGGERACVHGADAFPRSARRDPQRGRRPRPALDPLGLSFQLKLLWLSGYLPHLDACVECGAVEDLVGYLPSAGGAVCRACGHGHGAALARGAARHPDAAARPARRRARRWRSTDRGAREALAVVTASYEYHGGFRLRTLSA